MAVDIDKHNADKARRQAERDAKRDELLRCLSPDYAKSKERQKPLAEFSVSVKFLDEEVDERTNKTRHIFREFEDERIVAQDANEAWARFCDKFGVTKSRRDWPPVITRIRQLGDKEAIAFYDASSEDIADGVIPTVRMSSDKRKSKRK
jgi:hypothetical protein